MNKALPITQFKISRSFFVGSFSSCVSISVLYIATEYFGVWYITSSVAGYVVGIIMSFLLQRFFVFRVRALHAVFRQFSFYILFVCVSIALDTAMLYALVEFLGLWYICAQILIFVILGIFNFTVLSLIFRNVDGHEQKKRKKILIATGLYPPDIGGPATYSALLEQMLPERGFEVSVVSFGRTRHYSRGIRHILYFLLLIERGEDADIVLALDPVSVGLPAAVFSFVFRKTFILKVVGDYAWEQHQQKKLKDAERPFTVEEFQRELFHGRIRLLQAIERFVAKRAKKVIVPSVYLKNIVSEWGVPAEAIEVIYNAHNLEVLPDKETARRNLKLQGTVLISVGRLVPWKGFAELISLMPDILEEIPDATLLIVGDGPLLEHVQGAVARLQLQNNVLFLGRLEHSKLLQYIRAADVFVLNTGYEGFSHLLLEVMAAGTPVVTTRVGGNPEIIEHEVSGALVEWKNKVELKEWVVRVLKTHVGREFAENAKKRVAGFSKEKMLHQLVSFLNAI